MSCLSSDNASQRDISIKSRAALVNIHALDSEPNCCRNFKSTRDGEALVRATSSFNRRTYLADMVKAHSLGESPDRSAQRRELRDYGVGAQILLDLGVSEMILLSDTVKTIVGIEGYGLKVVEQRSIR